MKTEDRHWTGDDDMLERFVLNRLNADERAGAEQHLLTCEACRRSVRTEQELVAGIRRAGRDKLKQKISARVDRFDIPWPKIMSAAAMIGILTGVGIYNSWFASEEITQPTFTEEPVTTARPDSPEGLQGMDSRQPVQLNKGAPQSKKEAPAASEKVREHLDGQKKLRKERFRDAATPDAMAGRKKQEPEFASPAAEGTPTLIDEQKAAESGALTGGVEMDDVEQSQKSIWVEGTSTSTREIKSFKAVPYSSNKDKERRNDRQEIILKQQPASSIPPMRQQTQQGLGQEPVQTLVEQTTNGLQLTLFLPTGITEEALQNANIQQIGDDSLIVNLPGLQIAYKLPPGWNLQKQGTGVRK